MFNLDGKIALITGAAGGLGDKIARTLHAQSNIGFDGYACRTDGKIKS